MQHNVENFKRIKPKEKELWIFSPKQVSTANYFEIRTFY